MAKKKEVKSLLKELGYTYDQMQTFWDECIEINWKVRMIANSGQNWDDLSLFQIRSLPILKEETLKGLREKEKEERNKVLESQKKQEEEKYCQLSPTYVETYVEEGACSQKL